eukprot:IDg18358t1
MERLFFQCGSERHLSKCKGHFPDAARAYALTGLQEGVHAIKICA